MKSLLFLLNLWWRSFFCVSRLFKLYSSIEAFTVSWLFPRSWTNINVNVSSPQSLILLFDVSKHASTSCWSDRRPSARVSLTSISFWNRRFSHIHTRLINNEGQLRDGEQQDDSKYRNLTLTISTSWIMWLHVIN